MILGLSDLLLEEHGFWHCPRAAFNPAIFIQVFFFGYLANELGIASKLPGEGLKSPFLDCETQGKERSDECWNC